MIVFLCLIMKYLSFKYKETVDSPKACFAISKSDSSTNLKMQVQTIITVLISLTDFWLENDDMVINDHCWQKNKNSKTIRVKWEQGIGAVVRVFAFHQCGPVWFLDPWSWLGWVCWFSGFLLSPKTNIWLELIWLWVIWFSLSN